MVMEQRQIKQFMLGNLRRLMRKRVMSQYWIGVVFYISATENQIPARNERNISASSLLSNTYSGR